MTINPVINESNQRTNFVCVLRDITAMRRLNERLEYQSLHDPLTHLLNRRALEKTLEERVHQARLTNQPLAVGMLDLDDFKPVNDTYGHEAGDRLLKLVSQRLSERLREHDVLARIGGDEFVIIIGYLDDGNLAQQLQRILERLHEAIETPFEIEEGQLAWVGMSMGVALYPDDGAESDLLLRRADAALYRAKTHKHTQGLWWRRWIEESNSAKPLNP
jgi:diguanylate cyclase (GGDEF)-like protein